MQKLTLAQVETKIAQTFKLLSNDEVADHIQRGLLRSTHPEFFDGLSYALDEAKRRIGPEAKAAENSAWNAFEAKWGLSPELSHNEFAEKFDAIPESEWPQGGAHFLIDALRAA